MTFVSRFLRFFADFKAAFAFIVSQGIGASCIYAYKGHFSSAFRAFHSSFLLKYITFRFLQTRGRLSTMSLHSFRISRSIRLCSVCILRMCSYIYLLSVYYREKYLSYRRSVSVHLFFSFHLYKTDRTFFSHLLKYFFKVFLFVCLCKV